MWGEDPLALTDKVTFQGTGSMTAKLDGLKQGRRYYYQLGMRKRSGGQYDFGETQSFVTQRPPGERFSFAVIADTHVLGDERLSSRIENISRVAEMIAQEDVDFVVFVGDEVCLDGSGANDVGPRVCLDQDQVYQRYAEWRYVYAKLLACKPSFFILGNHDGEAGFYQEEYRHGRLYHWQEWGTIARKQYILNPRPDTYPEGGENDGWTPSASGLFVPDYQSGNRSPLENYFAWSWGDALFIGLDVLRYSGSSRPGKPSAWTLGKRQKEWLRQTFENSDKTHKFVLGHHLVGGGNWNPDATKPGGYGRGGAKVSRAGEQKHIHKLMSENGSSFYVYGHDHIFDASHRGRVKYVCCGRPSTLSTQWTRNVGWKELYDDKFQSLLGYTIFDVSPEEVTIRYKTSAGAQWRDIVWGGRSYHVGSGGVVQVESPVIEVIRVWDPDDPRQLDLFEGGSFEGDTIRLGPGFKGKQKKVNVIYVGQESFRRAYTVKSS